MEALPSDGSGRRGKAHSSLTTESQSLLTSAATTKTNLSPRRRRLRTTVAVLSVLVVLGSALGALLYFKTRPAQYRPDEQTADITSSLARNLPHDAPKPKFTDVTRAAGLASFRTFVGERTSQLPEDVGSGAAWGDYDNDGDDDLFLISAGGALNLPLEKLAPCELYENLGNGTFRKIEAFPETRIHGMGAAWGDYDSDGFLDLAVTGYDALLLFHNERGTGKFARDARLPKLRGFWSGASWGDYDNDRALDLYVGGYVQYDSTEADRERGSTQAGAFVPFTLNPASYLGGTNLLFHNDGDGTFTEVGARLKVQNPEGRSLGALWHDFDEDGWLDLYVANDISDNVFFRNTGRRFEDISHPALVADYRSAMGLAAGDYNRDGDDDLYVTHWVAQENALYDNLWADFNLRPVAADVRKLTSSNVSGKVGERVSEKSTEHPQVSHLPAHPLTHSPTNGSQSFVTSAVTNKYPLRFMDVADMKGLGQMALQFVGWGAEFADFDGDGWLDLIVANGNTLEFDGPFPKKLKPQEPFLLWNQRGEHFHNLAPLCQPLAEQHNSRGLAVADFDNDGDLDMLLVHLGEGVQLLRNDTQTGHWLRVRLRSLNARGLPLGFGDGTKVIAHVVGVLLRRAVSSVSYLSQSTRTLHFGLGGATNVDRLEIRWHAGGTNFFENLDANATYEVTEGEKTAKRVAADVRRLTSPNVSGKVGEWVGGNSTERAETSHLPTHSLTHSLSNGNQSLATSAATQRVDKARLLDFWNKQRAAMNAMKIEKDNAKAMALFREALALNPNHEDSRYYLGLCLASHGDPDGALTQLDELKRINPQSHRAWQQWGVLRAAFAKSDADLAAAEQSLERAYALNPEETGALLVLGEVSLLRGDAAKADERLIAASRTNPKAVGGFFLRAYLAWKHGDDATAKKLLEDARAALGKDWHPKGATAEGDVKQKQHVETTPLTRFWESWDGTSEPGRSFTRLNSFLKSQGP